MISTNKSRTETRGVSLKPGVRALVAAPDLVVLSTDADDTAVDGRLLPLLMPLLDGTRTVRQIARALGGRATPIDVQFGLELLDEGGWLAPNVRGTTPPQAAVAPRAASRLKGVGLPRPQGTVDVVVTDDYRRPDLREVAQQARASRRAWLPVRPLDTAIWIGPIVRPAGSPCWRCVTKRLDQSRPLLAAFPASAVVQGPRATPLSDAVLALVEILLARSPALSRSTLERHIVTIDLRTLTSTAHEVIPDPACSCQARTARVSRRRVRPLAVRLGRARRTPLIDGGYRTVSAEETWRRYARHVSAVTGIVRSVEPYYNDPRGLIHVYSATHAFVVDPSDREAARRGFRRTSTGKGMSPAQARASALCEALERHCGVYRGSETSRLATFEELGDRAIHPNACMGFSARQYAARAAARPGGRPETWVPQPFREDRRIAWTPAWSLTHERQRFLPTAYCYYGYPRDPEHDFCRADSNGAAAGNTIEEAILQGFFELVERDAVSLWWYNRLARPRVDLPAFRHSYVQALVDAYARLDRRVDLLDLTTDLRIPAFAAISRHRRTGRRCIFGFGAHVDPEIAASRALTEVNQFLPGALAHSRPERYDALARKPFLLADPGARPTRPTDFPVEPGADIAESVRRVVALMRARGLEMLVVDQTRPDVGLPVVKVIVPGLRPFWPRLAPGRLYDVPVRLGWRPRAPKEEDLNPVPFFV